MSVVQISREVERFLAEKDNELLVLKGRWGVGKTFFWRKSLVDACRADAIGKEYYSYVSLFGVNNLQDLKIALFTSRISSKTVCQNPTEKQLYDQFKSLYTQVKKAVKPFEQIPYIKNWTGGELHNAVFLAVRNSLICIDDIERKGSALSIKDLFGLISLLKDQRNCKIVLIVNDDTIPPVDKPEFRSQGEKLIDIELEFAPTAEEAFSYIFKDTQPYYSLIKKCCLQLHIKNIRILQRAKRYIDRLIAHLQGSEQQIIERAISALILYVWCHYDQESGAPTLKYIQEFSLYVALYRDTQNQGTEDTRRSNEILKNYGYTRTENFERYLIDYVEQGSLDADAFRTELETQNKIARIHRSQATISKAWELYRNSFNNNQDEFVYEISESFKNNISTLSMNDLQSTVKILRDLNEQNIASELVDLYMTLHKDELRSSSESMQGVLGITDDYITDSLRQMRNEYRHQAGLAEIIDRIATTGSVEHIDISYLSTQTVDDFYRYFKSVNSELLYQYARTCVELSAYREVYEEAPLIASRAKEALVRIGSESRLNRIRIQSMRGLNIELPPENTTTQSAK